MTSQRHLDIAIFGAGIAGLMSAITLRAQGHRCRIYERSSQALDAGMGFILLPEGIALLESFGVNLTGALSGTHLQRYLCRDSDGQVVFEQTMPAGSRGIRRRELTTALIRALGDENALVFAEVEKLHFGGDSQVMAATVRSSYGAERITADLYVGAEGVNSPARQAMFPDWPVTTDRVPEFVGMVRCRKAVEWAGHNLNKFHSAEGGLALGVLPVDEQHVVWYLQFDSQRFPLGHEAIYGNARDTAAPRRAFVEKLVGEWAHPLPSLLASTDFARVHLWRPLETDLIPRFSRENLVLVGDAAHPFSPFTSQGVASAIADAVVLAREVNGATSPRDLAQALERYSNQRHAQCAPYVTEGRELAQRFLEPLSEETAVLPVAVKCDHSPIDAPRTESPVRARRTQMYDAIVVGARCAGSPTALLLARKGYKVLLVDRSVFPSDMAFSNHFVHQAGSAALKRWGLLEQLAATNCPPITEDYFDYGAFSLTGPVPPVDGVNTAFAPRRIKLDPLLAAAAVEAGAELRDGFSIQELIWDNEQVTGIRGKCNGAVVSEKARIVVGADGMFSTVAKAVEAPEYKGQPGLEGSWYAYWSGVPMKGWHLWLRPNRVIFSYNTNDNLTLIGVAFPARELNAVRPRVKDHHWQTITEHTPELAERMRGGRRESRFVGGIIPYYMRRPYGPGWALVGDAGYQKDPCTASGITDAFRSAEWLAEAIDAGFSGRQPLEQALAAYEARRNQSETPYFDLTTQLAALAPPPPELQQLLAALQFNPEQRSRFFGVLAHAVPVEDFFSPENMQAIMAGRSRSAGAS